MIVDFYGSQGLSLKQTIENKTCDKHVYVWDTLMIPHVSSKAQVLFIQEIEVHLRFKYALLMFPGNTEYILLIF